MDLILVESPTKAKTLSRFLGGDFGVEATMGHVRDLPERKLGVKIKEDFEPDYVQTDKQKKRIEEIKKLSSKAEQVYLATDPDREGEAIAWHTQDLLKAKNYKRIVFHEITKHAIDEALKNPRKIDMPLVEAQQARRILDRLVGYKLSPLLWRKVRKGLSAGRVQSVALRLVVEKEREIGEFKADEYWDIGVDLKAQMGEFRAKLADEVGNQIEAEKVEMELRMAKYAVSGVEKKQFRRTPPAPFTTSTLQQAAANRMGWSAKKTMQVAQNLYEEGFITYHRTDSTNLAAEALTGAREYISQTYGVKFALNESRLYKTKSKVAQEAHEAIRPTDIKLTSLPADLMNRDKEKLYEMIWKRFAACQMAEAEGETLKINIAAGQRRLEARGEKVTFEGWYKLNGERDEEVALPEVKEGDKLEFMDLHKEQKFTQPPARFNDASLIKALEEMGIGRPSTYAPILSTIQDRQYVEKIEKRFKPTPLGDAVNDFLVNNFPDIVDFKFTAKLEDELDEIANGELKWRPMMAEFYEPFEKKLGTVGDTATRVKVEVETTGEKCPQCKEGDLVIRIGRFGRFIACSRYPECKYKANFQNKIGMKCPKCNEGDVIMRKTRSGKTFFGCSRYPGCDFASWTKPVAPQIQTAETQKTPVDDKI